MSAKKSLKEKRTFVPKYEKIDEEWAFIPNNKRYVISNYGEVLDIITKKQVPIMINSNNRVTIRLIDDKGTPNRFQLHRVVALCFLEQPDKNIQYQSVNHKDGNTLNNYVGNLEWLTSIENNIHALKNNLIPNNVFKYTKEEICQIYDLVNCKLFTHREIGEWYDIDRQSVTKIKTKKKFSYFLEDYKFNI